MTADTPAAALVVGGYGALGTAISRDLADQGWQVLRASRSSRMDDPAALVLDDTATGEVPELVVACFLPLMARAWRAATSRSVDRRRRRTNPRALVSRTRQKGRRVEHSGD